MVCRLSDSKDDWWSNWGFLVMVLVVFLDKGSQYIACIAISVCSLFIS